MYGLPAIQDLLDRHAGPIAIVSGEGAGPGTAQLFQGRRTARAIQSRLTRERAGGQRWAEALVYLYETPAGVPVAVYIEPEDRYVKTMWPLSLPWPREGSGGRRRTCS